VPRNNEPLNGNYQPLKPISHFWSLPSIKAPFKGQFLVRRRVLQGCHCA